MHNGELRDAKLQKVVAIMYLLAVNYLGIRCYQQLHSDLGRAWSWVNEGDHARIKLFQNLSLTGIGSFL